MLNHRVKSPAAFRIEVELDAENLILRFRGEKQTVKTLFTISRDNKGKPAEIGSCATCGENDCFRVVKPNENLLDFGRTRIGKRSRV